MAIVTVAGRVDRSGWPPGPWGDEPDLEYWLDTATALPCTALRRHGGHWCEYVGVRDGHPLYRGSYDSADSLLDEDVHGGLNFAGLLTNPEVMARPELHNVWWFGFSCDHYGDALPAVMGLPSMIGLTAAAINADSSYRTLEYVRGECTELAQQLDALQDAYGKPASPTPPAAPVPVGKRKIRIRRG